MHSLYLLAISWILGHKKLVLLTIVLFSIAAFTRLALLDQVPTTFTHDEIGYIINGLSISITGLGKTGAWSPFSLTPVEPHLAELPALYLAPMFLLPISWIVSTRLLFALMTLSIPISIGLISYKLIGSKISAYLSWTIALFNPWFWQNGRMAFDAVFSMWFYLYGITILLYANKYWKLFSLLPFILGFYCYQGYKVILLPLILVLVMFNLFQRSNKDDFVKKKWWFNQFPSLLVLVAVIFIVINYFLFQYSTQSHSQNRISGQLISPFSNEVIQAVETDRRLALGTPVNSLFLNKYSQSSKQVIGNYLELFSWRDLFYETSASNSSFTVWNHGVMYLLDSVLICIGIYALFRNNKKLTITSLLLLAVIGGFPSAINQGSWHFFRASFILPILIILGGHGAKYLFMSKRIIFIIVTFLYIISIVNFAFIYFVRYPVFASEDIFFSPRVLSNYISRIPSTQNVYVYDFEPEFSFTTHVLQNELFNRENAPFIQQQFREKTFSINNVTFFSCIPSNITYQENSVYVIDSRVVECETDSDERQINDELEVKNFPSPPLFIKSIKDSGTDYSIYGDQVCNYDSLPTYIYPHSLSQFNLSSLENDTFCHTWITQDLPSNR